MTAGSRPDAHWTAAAALGSAVVVLLVAAGVVLRVVADPPDHFSPLYLQDVAVGVAFPLLALVILLRMPRNRVGWLLLAMGAFGAVAVLSHEYVVAGVAGPLAPLPALGIASAVATGSWFPFMGLIPLFLLWLPEGSLPSPRWRPLVGLVVALNVVVMVVFGSVGWAEGPTFVVSDAEPEGLSGVVFGVMMGLHLLLLLAAFVSVYLRWRRAGDLERRQLKMIALAAVIGVAVVLAPVPEGGVGSVLDAVGILLVPAGIPLAVLRYRLYDIDRLVSRTVTYGLVMVVLAGLYVTAVVGLGALLRPLAGQSESQLVVAASTLLVAAAFQPVRRRVQDLVDRRFNRARYDAQRTVTEFAVTLRDAVDLDELEHRLLAVAQTTVQPGNASVWLRAGGKR
jgi:hypothetical protein